MKKIFFVPGNPAAKGSRSFFWAKSGRIANRESSKKVAPWMAVIRLFAMKYRPSRPWLGPIEVGLEFIMPRPADHFIDNDRSRGLKQRAPYWHTGKKDFDKLERAIYDALEGVFYANDGQICYLKNKTKHYPTGNQIPGVNIYIAEIDYDK